MALAATDVVPDASGDATITKTDSGWRIRLDATGLPRLDGGRFYEAWLRRAGGHPRQRRDVQRAGQRDPVVRGLPSHFTAFAVTQEEADGNPESSGRRVLIGQVDVDG